MGSAHIFVWYKKLSNLGQLTVITTQFDVMIHWWFSESYNNGSICFFSVAGPNFADVSAISVGGSNSTFASIDETVDITMRNNQSMANVKDIGETRLECTIGNDVTVAPADVFLDDCKVILFSHKLIVEFMLCGCFT